MHTPPFISAGDLILVTAPARKVLESDIQPAVDWLKREGFQVEVLLPEIGSAEHSYLAGIDLNRLQQLQFCLDHPTAKAIICARGGYGTSRIIDQLDLKKFSQHPKWVVGFSDITHLHLRLLQIEVSSIHGTMPIQVKENDDSLKSLISRLQGNLDPLIAQPSPFNRTGSSSGKLMGGNLSILVDSLGTKTCPDFQKAILLLEEVDEPAYKIDRMLVHLRRAGVFQQIAGLAIGYFTRISEGELPFGESFQQIILNHTADFTFPIGFGFPSGHEKPNLSWFSGMKVQFEVNPEGSRLEFKPDFPDPQ